MSEAATSALDPTRFSWNLSGGKLTARTLGSGLLKGVSGVNELMLAGSVGEQVYDDWHNGQYKAMAGDAGKGVLAFGMVIPMPIFNDVIAGTIDGKRQLGDQKDLQEGLGDYVHQFNTLRDNGFGINPGEGQLAKQMTALNNQILRLDIARPDEYENRLDLMHETATNVADYLQSSMDRGGADAARVQKYVADLGYKNVSDYVTDLRDIAAKTGPEPPPVAIDPKDNPLTTTPLQNDPQQAPKINVAMNDPKNTPPTEETNMSGNPFIDTPLDSPSETAAAAPLPSPDGDIFPLMPADVPPVAPPAVSPEVPATTAQASAVPPSDNPIVTTPLDPEQAPPATAASPPVVPTVAPAPAPPAASAPLNPFINTALSPNDLSADDAKMLDQVKTIIKQTADDPGVKKYVESQPQANQAFFGRGAAVGKLLIGVAGDPESIEALGDKFDILKKSNDAFNDPELGRILWTASAVAKKMHDNPKANIAALISDNQADAEKDYLAWQKEEQARRAAPQTSAPAEKTQEVVWNPQPGSHDCLMLTYNPADKKVDVTLYQNGGPVAVRLDKKPNVLTNLTGTITDVDAQGFERIKAAAHNFDQYVFSDMLSGTQYGRKSEFDAVMSNLKGHADGTLPTPGATPPATTSPAATPAPGTVVTPPGTAQPAATALPARAVHGYSKIKVNGTDHEISYVSSSQTGTSYTYAPSGQAKQENISEDKVVGLTGDKHIDEKIGSTEALNGDELNRLNGYSAHLPNHGSMQPVMPVTYDPYQGRYPGPRAGPDSLTYTSQSGQPLTYNQMTRGQQTTYWMAMNRTNG